MITPCAIIPRKVFLKTKHIASDARGSKSVIDLKVDGEYPRYPFKGTLIELNVVRRYPLRLTGSVQREVAHVPIARLRIGFKGLSAKSNSHGGA